MLKTFLPFLLVVIFSCSEKESVDAIYHNGSILTMTDQITVEAVTVKNGKVHSIGSYENLGHYVNSETEIFDLNGKAMLPGFIDAHSHFSFAMRLARQADLSPPPIGKINSIASMVEALKTQREKYQIPEGEWVIGWGYDQDQFSELRHPNRYDLDNEFPEHPVFLLHISGHMVVINSKALDMLGITGETPSPAGGVIVKMKGSSEPSGLLQETAGYLARKALPKPSPEDYQILLQKTQDFYARHGITSAQDGLIEPQEFEFLEWAASENKLIIDIHALGSFQFAEEWIGDYSDKFGVDRNGLTLSGIKIVSDGSPQGKTAFFSKPYLTEVPGCAHTCTGVPIVSQEELDLLIEGTYSNGIQTYIHCNGDGAIDLLLASHEKHQNLWKGDSSGPRTVIIHSQFVRPDQLDHYANYGFVPSFFTNHAFYWGDVHLKNLGSERANFLSPLKTSLSKGITFTNHTDYMVTPLNQLFLVSTAVNRKSRSGKTIGVEERISPLEALKAVTINSAFQHRVEDSKGSIEVGKMADFVILDKNPLAVNVEEIQHIKVLETIKEGSSIYILN